MHAGMRLRIFYVMTAAWAACRLLFRGNQPSGWLLLLQLLLLMNYDNRDYELLPAGSSDFLSLPGMNGLHGWAFIGPLVCQTTSN